MERPNHAAHVTLVNMEAVKESARHAQQVLFKTPRASRHAKNVQSTRIFLKKASRRKLTAKNVARRNQREQRHQTKMHRHACARKHFFTEMLPMTLATSALLALTVLIKMAFILTKSWRLTDFGVHILLLKFLVRSFFSFFPSSFFSPHSFFIVPMLPHALLTHAHPFFILCLPSLFSLHLPSQVIAAKATAAQTKIY